MPDFNEYVWVPIPESDDFDREAWTTKYGYDASGNWVSGTGAGSIENTGTSEYWKANNIYDLAGNADEWTQERYSTELNRAWRGGGISCDNGVVGPVASRYYDGASTQSYYLRFQS